MAEEGLSTNLQDEVVIVDGIDGIKTASALAKHECIFTGTSGGSTMKVALDVAAKAPKGSTVLTMIPDTAERYLSTPLFADIDAEMDESEVEISQSTPNAQLPAP